MKLSQIFNSLIYKNLYARKQVGDDNFTFYRADIYFNCPNCNLKANIGLEPVKFLIMICPDCKTVYQIHNSKVNRFTGKVSIDVIKHDSIERMEDVKKLYEPDSGVKISYDKTHFVDKQAKLNKLGRIKKHGDQTDTYHRH